MSKIKLVTHPLATKRGWKVGVDFPEWGNNPYYLNTVQGTYLVDKETPKDAYHRLADTAAMHLATAEQPTLDTDRLDFLKGKFFEILWNGWLIPSTPVMCNMGTSRGLPISCFSGMVGDNMYDIYRKNTEMAMLSKYGGGTAYDFSLVRAKGSPIKGGQNGSSDGIIPFIKSYDSTILASKQGKTRRGAVAIYLDSEHAEFPEFLRLRTGKGEINRQCNTIHQGSKWSDVMMDLVKTKKGKERELWLETLKTRIKTGEPYIFFTDNANKNLPDFWKARGLSIKHSNLCSEIFLPTDENHTLVCCLSSMNLSKWEEWKDTEAVYYATMFLDSVITEFLIKSEGIPGIEDSRSFAKKSRALGLGALGWHTLLQSKMIPFVGIMANSLTRIIFGHIDQETQRSTKDMTVTYGEPEWCEGQGIRNLTRIAIAPNKTSADTGGGVSESVGPITANVSVEDKAKGLHIKKNIILEQVLEEKGLNTKEVWEQIEYDNGSVQGLKGLSKEEKEVFLTAREINQLELVRQAGIRQQFIDQGQSINLFFFQDAEAKFINKVHLEAHEVGLKSLYYLKSESNLRADKALQRDLYSECLSCEG